MLSRKRRQIYAHGFHALKQEGGAKAAPAYFVGEAAGAYLHAHFLRRVASSSMPMPF